MAESCNGDIVGFAVSGPESEDSSEFAGEIYAIYILAEFQRQGMGRCLFKTSCVGLLEAGIGSMLLWVLEDNHSARLFYESLGGEVIRSKKISIGGVELVEVAYGWKDIARLVG